MSLVESFHFLPVTAPPSEFGIAKVNPPGLSFSALLSLLPSVTAAATHHSGPAKRKKTKNYNNNNNNSKRKKKKKAHDACTLRLPPASAQDALPSRGIEAFNHNWQTSVIETERTPRVVFISLCCVIEQHGVLADK